jgi:hypothetical protein
LGAHVGGGGGGGGCQVLWDMLDMNCAWADRNPEWPSTAHILAGHLATVCLPEQAATHYIVASQVLYTRRLLLFRSLAQRRLCRARWCVCVCVCVCVC